MINYFINYIIFLFNKYLGYDTQPGIILASIYDNLILRVL